MTTAVHSAPRELNLAELSQVAGGQADSLDGIVLAEVFVIAESVKPAIGSEVFVLAE